MTERSGDYTAGIRSLRDQLAGRCLGCGAETDGSLVCPDCKRPPLRPVAADPPCCGDPGDCDGCNKETE